MAGKQDDPFSRLPPATTPEDRELQLIAAAERLAERQILEGTASSQVITHYLKLGSSSERLSQRHREEEIKLMRIRTEAIAAQNRTEELVQGAIAAIKKYTGASDDPAAIDV